MGCGGMLPAGRKAKWKEKGSLVRLLTTCSKGQMNGTLLTKAQLDNEVQKDETSGHSSGVFS